MAKVVNTIAYCKRICSSAAKGLAHLPIGNAQFDIGNAIRRKPFLLIASCLLPIDKWPRDSEPPEINSGQAAHSDPTVGRPVGKEGRELP